MDPENFQAMRNIARPQSWNGYSYVNNNPLRSVDPSGLAEQGGDLLEILRNGLSYGYWMTDAELHAAAVAARTQVAVEFGISDPESGLVRGIDLSRKSDGEALLIRDQLVKLREEGKILQYEPPEPIVTSPIASTAPSKLSANQKRE